MKSLSLYRDQGRVKKDYVVSTVQQWRPVWPFSLNWQDNSDEKEMRIKKKKMLNGFKVRQSKTNQTDIIFMKKKIKKIGPRIAFSATCKLLPGEKNMLDDNLKQRFGNCFA